MKKAATLAAVSAIAATTITGAAAATSAERTTTHTKRFVSLEIERHVWGPHAYAGAAVDRSFGHILGYEAFTGHSDRFGDTILASFAFKGGTMSVTIRTGGGSVYGGEILNGTGKYKGVHGTLNVRPAPHNPKKNYIRLTYYF
jgi:hypothetical protein